VVNRPALRASNRIYLQFHVADSERCEQISGNADDLGVLRGLLAAERFYAELLMLAEAARLRLVVPKTAYDIADFERQDAAQHPVFQHCADSARRALRPQCQRFAAHLEGVHLFLHYVGALAHRTREQLGFLQRGYAQFTVAIGGGNAQCGAFYMAAALAVGRQDILHSAHTF
jgi:hypothetical protein